MRFWGRNSFRGSSRARSVKVSSRSLISALQSLLFEGGLNLQWSRLRRQEAVIRGLITIGAFVTLVGATLSAGLVLGWRWDLSLLFGSLVIVTGPTVVAPLLRDMRLQPRLRTILEAEGVFIDPVGALLAAALLQIVLTPAPETLAAEAQLVAASLGFGVVGGIVAGLVLVAALRYGLIVASGYEHIFTLAAVVLLFEACGAVVPESGLMAVTVTGVVVGNFKTRVGEELREFKDRLTVMLVGLLFVLLAADVSVADLRALGRPGLIVVAGLITIVRPLSVWFATIGSELNGRERTFIAAVPARYRRGRRGVDHGGESREPRYRRRSATESARVLVIGATVIVSGLTARPLAGLLSVRLPRRDRVAILGARGLAFPLAEQLRKADVPVVFLEFDPKRSRMAEEAGYAVVFGDPLEERTFLRARPELVGKAVGATSNEHFNSLFVRQALDAFDVPHGLIAVESLFGEQSPSLLPPEDADVLFDGPHDHERWDVRWRHQQVVVEAFEYSPIDAAAPRGPDQPGRAAARSRELFAIVTLRRGRRVSPMRMGYEFGAGDVAAMAIHAPDHREGCRDT